MYRQSACHLRGRRIGMGIVGRLGDESYRQQHAFCTDDDADGDAADQSVRT